MQTSSAQGRPAGLDELLVNLSGPSQDRIVYYASVFLTNPEIKNDFKITQTSLTLFKGK